LKKHKFFLYLAVIGLILPAVTAADAYFATGPTVTTAHAPFQGMRVDRAVNILADGTTITHDMRGRFARDSEGRVYEEEQQVIDGGAAMPGAPMRTTMIDPVKHFTLHWSTAPPPRGSPKIADVMGLSEVVNVTFPLQFSIPNYREPTPAPGVEPDKVTTENLGQKTIDGVVTTGTRTITMIPTNKVGNDRPLKIVHDVWFSKDLDLALIEIVEDPRLGRDTLEIHDISRVEPDPGLFRAPAGYEVRNPLLGGVVGGTSAMSKQ
jgi:hypothetical protein